MLIGGGGHAVVVAEAAALTGVRLAGFLDDNPAASLGLLPFKLPHPFPVPPHLGDLGDLRPIAHHDWVLALGDVRLRRRLLGLLDGQGFLGPRPGNAEHPMCVVHPAASLSPSALLGQGVFVGPMAVLHARARVDSHAIINSGAIVEHDGVIGENTHVAPGAAIGGGAQIGHDVLVGLGSRVLPGVKIGAGAIVGAGAVVLRDVPAGATVVGVPGRVIRG